VKLGPRAGEHYVVLEGLEEGERVVIRGTFKIDSAMQILARPSMMSPEGGVAPPGHHHHGDGGPGTGAEAVKSHAAPAAFLEQLDPVIGGYLQMHDALASDDVEGAKGGAADMVSALDGTDMSLLEGDAHVQWMKLLEQLEDPLESVSSQEDLDGMREHFSPLSDAVILTVRSFGTTGHGTLHFKHCPMAFDNAGANWLQSDEPTRNPYFGASMLSCANDVETLGGDE
jgi:Cu(I)/Ag(I) efflux system membrane fusion protein